MFASLQKKYFLSDKGVSGVKHGILWCTLTNLVTMAGMAFLYLAMAGFIEHLLLGADLPGFVPIAAGLVAFALLFLTRKPMAGVFEGVRAGKVRVTERIQETIDCAHEIRATNQEGHYLAGLNAVIDAEERRAAKGELANGLLVNSAFAVLRLGIATTLIAGAQMVAAGQLDFMAMFAFLLMVSRIYAPFDQALMLVSELFASEASAKRMRSIMEESLAAGSADFRPRGHDVEFDHVAFGYGAGAGGRAGERVLCDVSFVAKEGQVTALVGPSGSGKST